VNDIEAFSIQKCYSGARNAADRFFTERPDLFTPENAPYDFFYAAEASWHLCDYVYAAQLARQALPFVSGQDRERLKKLTEIPPDAPHPKIHCPDERLKAVLERLSYVFHHIDKPVRVFIADCEEAYRMFWEIQFHDFPYFDYKGFLAAGIYYDQSCYWIVFKKDFLKKHSDDALLGTCAHELGHLDLYCCKASSDFLRNEARYEGDHPIDTEWSCDLYAISKGLGYRLYQARKLFGASSSVMSAADIFDCIKRPEQT